MQQQHQDPYHHSTELAVTGDVDLCLLEDLRLFYIHHPSKSSYLEPPLVAWDCQLNLPYGWEEAIDVFGDTYYINTRLVFSHLERKTSFIDPRSLSPAANTVTRPVQRVRRKSANVFGGTAELTTPNKPFRRKRDCHVRFRDEVAHLLPEQSKNLKGTGNVANTITVHLENGQSKTLKYTDGTTAEALQSHLLVKLKFTCGERFALFTEESPWSKFHKLHLVRPEQSIVKLYSRPTLSDSPCCRVYLRLRLIFMPLHIRQFAKQHPTAFRYLFNQCTNDVVSGRFASEMRYEACLRLAILHMRLASVNIQRAGTLINGGFLRSRHRSKESERGAEIDLKRIEATYGFAAFLPTLLLQNVKPRQLRKHLRYLAKLDQEQTSGKATREEQNREFEKTAGDTSMLRTASSCKGKQLVGNCAPRFWRCGKKDDQQLQEKRDFLISPRMRKQSEAGHPNGFSYHRSSTNESETTMENEPDDLEVKIGMQYLQIASNLPSFAGCCFAATRKPDFLDVILEINPRDGLAIHHLNLSKRPSTPSVPSTPMPTGTTLIAFQCVKRFFAGVESDSLRVIKIGATFPNELKMLEFLVDKEDLEPFVNYLRGYVRATCGHAVPVYHIASNGNKLSAIGDLPPPYETTHIVRAAGWNYTSAVVCGSTMILNLASNSTPPNYELAIRTAITDEDNVPLERDTRHSLDDGRRVSPLNRARQSAESELMGRERPRLSLSNFLLPMRFRAVSAFCTGGDDSFDRNHAKLPRAKDSIRLHRQRHSVPTGEPRRDSRSDVNSLCQNERRSSRTPWMHSDNQASAFTSPLTSTGDILQTEEKSMQGPRIRKRHSLASPQSLMPLTLSQK